MLNFVAYMDTGAEERWLEAKGVKTTANRKLVMRMLIGAGRPLSLADLEERMPSMDRSSIFRVLSLFLAHDIVHGFEDGRGVVNYEMCHNGGECNHSDEHIHFYCERCRRSFCMDHVDLDGLRLPEGFSPRAISFVVKGLCPDCRDR